MLKRAAIFLIAAGITICAAETGAVAQGCTEKAAEASAANKDAAMRLAYDAVLRAIDPNLSRAWTAAGQRVGDAPGYTVRKLNSNCTAGGAGQTCRIAATLCRN